MKKLYTLLGVIAIGAVIAIGLVGCDNGSTDDNGGGGGSSLDGVWSQANGSAIRFLNGNLQSTNDVTATNVNWTLEGTYTYSSPTLTVTPPPQNGIVQNSVQGTAVVSGIQLTISGLPGNIGLNGNWTKQ
jgi:hypothetical protein